MDFRLSGKCDAIRAKTQTSLKTGEQSSLLMRIAMTESGSSSALTKKLTAFLELEKSRTRNYECRSAIKYCDLVSVLTSQGKFDRLHVPIG
jgi:hypothetical protein